MAVCCAVVVQRLPMSSFARRGRTPPRKSRQHIELLDWQQDEIREAFNLFDAEATGQISYRELRAAMRALDYVPRRAELRGLISAADPEETGFVTFEGFHSIMSKHAAAVDLRSEVDKIFELMAGGRGAKSITRHNLREVARELGETMSDDDLEAMLEMLSSSSGDISREDFARIMIPTSGKDLDEEDLDDLDG